MRSEIDLRHNAVELEFQASGLRRKRLVRGRCRNHAFLDAREVSIAASCFGTMRTFRVFLVVSWPSR